MNRVTLLIIFLLAILGGLILHETVTPTGFIYNYLHPTAPPTPHRRRPMVVPPWYSGLAPQKVVETDEADPTRDTYQRKVFNDGTNFFLVYWTGAPTREVRYVASVEGTTWTSPSTLWGFSVAPYYGGNADIEYPNRGAKDQAERAMDFSIHVIGSNGLISNWQCMNISGQTLINVGGGQLTTTAAQGGSLVASLDGTNEFAIFHESQNNWTSIHKRKVDQKGFVSLSYGATTSGGAQLLRYKTSSPYHLLAIAKGGDNKLYWSIFNATSETFVISNFTELVTLGSGFSDFCACSEAQDVGQPEKIHLTYIKYSGELCYRNFQNDAWSNEEVLLTSGASYPVIACGSNGKLYVFCVKDGSIWVIHYDGSNWFNPLTLFPEHTYNNPTYLSTNQNVQSGKICLVWTEGTSSPYEVWFSYINDE